MGIRGLYSFMNSIPESYRDVNIIEELRKFRAERGVDPVIIINLWTLSNHYNADLRDTLFGGRLNEIKAEFEHFLTTLCDNGAKLIFVFKKNQHKEWDFVVNAEEDYKSGCEILDVIATIKKTEDVVKHFERNPRYLYPYNQSVLLVLTQTAGRYGELRGMDSVNCRPSTVHIQIANQEQALALIGLDTYYIFYEGSWKFWSDNDLDIKTMTIREYNKELVLDHLELNIEKAPLFVALAGGLYTSEANVKKIAQFFKPGWWVDRQFSKQLLQNVSDFVNRQRFPINKDTLASIVTEIFGKNDPQVVADFRRTLDLMNPNAKSAFASRFDKKLMEITENDFVNYASQILTNEAIYISPIFMDLRRNDMKPVHSLATHWIQKTAGILLKHLNDHKPRTLLAKLKHDAKPVEIKINPIFPNFDIPSLHDLITGKMSTVKARKLLMWICDCHDIADKLDKVPDDKLSDIIVLNHCIKNKSLKGFEAKFIMQTIVDVGNGNVLDNIEYPTNMNERGLRVCLLYSKLVFILHSCLSSIGLKRYQADYQFDNVYYQKICEEAQNGRKAAKELDNCMGILSSLIKIAA